MTVSLKSEILEKLELKKSKAKTKPLKEQAKQQRQPARPARRQPKKGDKMLYEGKTVTFASYNPETGMAVVNRGRKSQIIVRARDLKAPQQLNEGVLGLAPIAPTYVERPTMTTPSFEPLRAEDIGLFFEDEFTGDDDEQEDVADNGSNIRYDGHTGRKEVDELPTPSDTIAPAYSSDKPPKEISKPLSTEPGYTVATDPDFDGYDYPADAPEIPTADFAGADAGNPRAPDQDGHYEPDESDDGGEKEEVEETVGFNKFKNRLAHKSKIRNPAAVAAGIGNKKYGKAISGRHPMESFAFITNVLERWHGDDEDVEDRRAGRDRDKSSYRDERKAKEREREQQMEQLIRERWHGDDENADDRRSGKDRDKKTYRNERKAKEREREQQMEQLIREMGDMLGNGEDREPKSGETITVTLPAMASIVCTVAHRMGADVHEGGQDYTLLRSMIEALAEFGHGSSSGCIDVPDLQAVASHMNGEESQEMHNRDEGHPDHEGMHGEEEHHEPADNWPGDMEKSRTGKTKLFQNRFSESGDFYGYEDIVAETRLTDEQELRLIKKRAGLKFW